MARNLCSDEWSDAVKVGCDWSISVKIFKASFFQYETLAFTATCAFYFLEGYETSIYQVSGVYVETYIVVSNVQLKGVTAAQKLLHASHYCRAELNCIKFDSSARVDN